MVFVSFKYVLLMVIIAVLFSVFTNSLGNAFQERPEYADYCKDDYAYLAKPVLANDESCPALAPSQEAIDACNEQKGRLTPAYDSRGCASSYRCETCDLSFSQAQEQFDLYVFLFMAVLGIIAIIATLIARGEGVVEWIMNGFLLGGLISLFVGTIIYFQDAPRALRPIIMLVELVIVIAVAYRKMGGKRNGENPQEKAYKPKPR